MMPICEAGLIHDAIYSDCKSQIVKFLSGEDGYKDQPEYVECVAKRIMLTDFIDRIASGRNLIDEVKSIKGKFEFDCDIERFILSPIGIVTVFLLIFIVVVCMCVKHFYAKPAVLTFHIPADFRKNKDLYIEIVKKNTLCN